MMKKRGTFLMPGPVNPEKFDEARAAKFPPAIQEKMRRSFAAQPEMIPDVAQNVARAKLGGGRSEIAAVWAAAPIRDQAHATRRRAIST